MFRNDRQSKCEYCNLTLINDGDVKRHILSVSHLRSKRNFELSKENYISRRLASTRQPNSLSRLLDLLKLTTAEQVSMLMSDGDFFSIRSDDKAAVVRQLIVVLSSELVQYYIKKLPHEMRKPFQDRLMEEDERRRRENHDVAGHQANNDSIPSN